MSLSLRSEHLLKILIERFIADGQPLASKALVEHTGLDISSATIRSIMSNLEGLGLVTSIHTSSGKVPTAKAYRFFVDSLISHKDYSTNNPINIENKNLYSIKNDIMHMLKQKSPSPKQALADISQIISELTSYACILSTPYQDEILQQVELIKLASHKILLIFISKNGEIQNYIFSTQIEYKQEQLNEAMQFINNYCEGLTISTIHSRLAQDINSLQTYILELTQATMSINKKLNKRNNLLITGERQLIASDLSKNMQELRKLFELFDKKQELLAFLHEFSKAHGVSIFIGGDNEVKSSISTSVNSKIINNSSDINQVTSNISMVTTPFNQDNNIIGTLGVIGPTRMQYNKVIYILNITTQCMQEYYSNNK